MILNLSFKYTLCITMADVNGWIYVHNDINDVKPMYKCRNIIISFVLDVVRKWVNGKKFIDVWEFKWEINSIIRGIVGNEWNYI